MAITNGGNMMEIFNRHFKATGQVRVNDDGTIDVDGDCEMTARPGGNAAGNRMPVRFGRVTGTFDVSSQGLTSLEGSPATVGKGYVANDNPLRDLQGISSIDIESGTVLHLENCNLTGLQGIPWASRIYLSRNHGLKSLQGIPDQGICSIWATGCNLADLHGCPGKCRGIDIRDQVSPMRSLEGLPPRLQWFKIDDTAPLLKILETRLVPGKAAAEAAARAGRGFWSHFQIVGEVKKVADIMRLLEELYPDGDDAIPAMAMELIKLGYRQNARF